MASPRTAYGSEASCAWAGPTARTIVTESARATRISAEDFICDCLEPAGCEGRFERTYGARRVRGADATRALNFSQNPVHRTINAGDIDAIVRRNQGVACVDEFRFSRGLAAEKLR